MMGQKTENIGSVSLKADPFLGKSPTFERMLFSIMRKFLVRI
jgi:hypothetical protein